MKLSVKSTVRSTKRRFVGGPPVVLTLSWAV